jgi:hypothetical protein
MKHIINYLGTLLAVVLISATFTACSENDDNGSANVGLGIKVFSPTKVVTNQPMTINGSGFSAATEIEFPGGVKVSNFEIVSDDMIRVNAPSGISAEGGKIIVRTASEETESRLPLTIGHTNVTGFSKQPGETANGGEQITVFGSDLEFVNAVELLDAEGNTLLIDHKDFYRKGTSNLIFTLPKFNIYKGTFVGYIYTFDGQKIPMPELAYEPAATGHWETVKTTIWKNNDPEGNGAISWSGKYRFCEDGHDANNECIATFPTDIWNKVKTGAFFIKYTPADPTSYQVRVTTGWWDPQWLGKENDIAPWNMAERIIDNEDGTFTIEVEFGDDPIVDALDDRHLLITGNGFTPLELYFAEEVWVEEGEGGPSEYDIKLFTVYQNEGGNTEPTLEYPYNRSWGSDAGKLRIMRGMGDPALENLGLTTSSKFVVYKEVGTTGQIQFNNPNWGDLNAGCNDWAGDKETIEVPITEDMLKCINGEISDGWSNTALILQGDGLTVTKIVIVP